MKTKLYVVAPRPGGKVVSLISLVRGKDIARSDNVLFKERLPDDFAITSVDFTDNVGAADYILIPQAIIREPNASLCAYLDSVRSLAQRHGKEIIVFIGGDLSHDIFIDDLIVLKGTQYRYMKRDNEIIVPGFVEDIEWKSGMREKTERPIVGFCGWAGFPSLKARLRYEARNMLCDVKALLGDPYAGAHKKGLWFRRRAMRAFKAAPEIETRFIVRTTFSGNRTTIALDPGEARAEYLNNMAESHFALAPKGEANFSIRFFEAFAMGSIPILIDTECCLPLEDLVPYDDLIVRVPWRDVDRTAEYVLEKWQSLTPAAYEKLQGELTAVFRHFLRYDAFMNRLFSEVLTSDRARRKQHVATRG